MSGFQIDRVQMACHPGDSVVEFNYRGTAADLLACGAVEPGMTDPGGGGVLRLDSHGNHFWRTKHADGTFTIRRRIRQTEYARTLPGALTDLSTPILAWLHEHPGEVDDDIEESREGWTCFTGSKEALIKAGIAREAYFQVKFGQYTEDHWGDGFIIKRLRDGFFMIQTEGRKPATLPKANPSGVRQVTRQMGRFRIAVTWAVIEKLIIPDWKALQQQVLERRSGSPA